MATFGDRLRSLRIEKGLSQEEFGSIFNMTKSRISQYETGKHQADDETKKIFANYFTVSLDYLMGRTSIRNPESLSLNNDFATAITKIFNNEDEFIKNIFIEISKWTEEDRETMKKAATIIKRSTF